jgi:hypothetical protein
LKSDRCRSKKIYDLRFTIDDFARCCCWREASWNAVAERGDETALETPALPESGVALRFPPHSKT